MKSLAFLLLIGLAATALTGSTVLQNQTAHSILGKWMLLRMRDNQGSQPAGKAQSAGRYFTRGPALDFLPNGSVNAVFLDSTSENLGRFAIDNDSTLVLSSQDNEERYAIQTLPLGDTLKLKGNKLVVWYLRMK